MARYPLQMDNNKIPILDGMPQADTQFLGILPTLKSVADTFGITWRYYSKSRKVKKGYRKRIINPSSSRLGRKQRT